MTTPRYFSVRPFLISKMNINDVAGDVVSACGGLVGRQLGGFQPYHPPPFRFNYVRNYGWHIIT